MLISIPAFAFEFKEKGFKKRRKNYPNLKFKI